MLALIKCLYCNNKKDEQDVNQESLLPLLPLRFSDRKIFFLGGSFSAAVDDTAVAGNGDANAAAAAAAPAASAADRCFSAC